jgi:hypothetical protein
MAHWLDEIERLESRKHRSASSSARVQDKKFRIQQNYQKNKEIYDGFINKMKSLAERVNNLPIEYRDVFGKITFKAKNSKLDNQLNYFSSSRRLQKLQFKSLLNPLKQVHFKHVRVIYLNVAKIMDKVEIELLEEYLEKKRKDGQLVSDEAHKLFAHKPHSDINKFHEVYYYDMSKLNDELALNIIDWLAFHEEIEHIPVIEQGEVRFKE